MDKLRVSRGRLIAARSAELCNIIYLLHKSARMGSSNYSVSSTIIQHLLRDISSSMDNHPAQHIQHQPIDDRTICKNMLRSLLNIRLDYEHTRYMWQVMKVLRRKPLETSPQHHQHKQQQQQHHQHKQQQHHKHKQQ